MLSEVFNVSPEWSAHFLLVLARLSAAIVAAPILGARAVPPQTKIGLALLLSLIVVPLQGQQLTAIPTNLFVFVSLVGSEVLVGIALGIGISLVFSAMEMGASLISVQMGFGIGGIFDPLSGAQTGAIEQFYRVFVTLIFFAMNGHFLGCIDTDAHLVALDAQHGEGDVLTDHHRFAYAPGQNQHFLLLQSVLWIVALDSQAGSGNALRRS